MKDVIFWGGTGHAKVLNEAINKAEYRLVAIVDNRKLVKSPVDGVPLLHGMNDLSNWLLGRGAEEVLPFAAIAVGGARGKDRLELIASLASTGIFPITILHHRAFVAEDAELGEGAQVLAMAAVGSHAKLGRAVIINTSASVDHDCIIGDGVHIGPGASLAGEVVVSKNAFIGTGAVILPRIHIGEGAIVGAGAVVTNNVAPYATVVGNPARTIS